MNKNIFLLLGGNKLNYGIQKKMQKNGFLVYVIDWNENPDLKGDKHLQIDVKNADLIIKTLKDLNIIDKVMFAYSSIDLAVPTVAKINREIGLKTISDQALINSVSKTKQSNAWNSQGILNKISKSYDKFDSEIIDLNNNYKLIVKPDNAASSRGITILNKNSNKDAILSAFKKAQSEATNSIVVVEEFVEGIEHTVEMIGDSFGNVSVYAISRKTHTNNTNNNKIAVKLHYNSESIELQNKIAEFGIKCYKALGFSSSFGHLEIILKNNGEIVPVEIGARSSGFIASDLVDIVSGSDFINDLIKVQNGCKVQNGLHQQTNSSSMYFFYDFPENITIKKECNLLDFTDKSISSRYYDRNNIKLNNLFKKIENDNARLGFEILEGPKEIMTIDYINSKEHEMLNYMFGDK